MDKKEFDQKPTTDQLQIELNRVKYQSRFRIALKNTVFSLITVAAIAILVATLWLPILEIYGTSMNPTLNDGQIIVTMKTSHFEYGDIIAFYYNNQVLVKRVIAKEGQWIDIDENGNVYVDKIPLEEPFVSDKALGNTDIELPYQVPDGKIFVMGDHRSTSIDSRNSAVGCVSQEQIVGKIILRIWPLNQFGSVE